MFHPMFCEQYGTVQDPIVGPRDNFDDYDSDDSEDVEHPGQGEVHEPYSFVGDQWQEPTADYEPFLGECREEFFSVFEPKGTVEVVGDLDGQIARCRTLLPLLTYYCGEDRGTFNFTSKIQRWNTYLGTSYAIADNDNFRSFFGNKHHPMSLVPSISLLILTKECGIKLHLMMFVFLEPKNRYFTDDMLMVMAAARHGAIYAHRRYRPWQLATCEGQEAYSSKMSSLPNTSTSIGDKDAKDSAEQLLYTMDYNVGMLFLLTMEEVIHELAWTDKRRWSLDYFAADLCGLYGDTRVIDPEKLRLAAQNMSTKCHYAFFNFGSKDLLKSDPIVVDVWHDLELRRAASISVNEVATSMSRLFYQPSDDNAWRVAGVTLETDFAVSLRPTTRGLSFLPLGADSKTFIEKSMNRPHSEAAEEYKGHLGWCDGKKFHVLERSARQVPLDSDPPVHSINHANVMYDATLEAWEDNVSLVDDCRKISYTRKTRYRPARRSARLASQPVLPPTAARVAASEGQQVGLPDSVADEPSDDEGNGPRFVTQDSLPPEDDADGTGGEREEGDVSPVADDTEEDDDQQQDLIEAAVEAIDVGPDDDNDIEMSLRALAPLVLPPTSIYELFLSQGFIGNAQTSKIEIEVSIPDSASCGWDLVYKGDNNRSNNRVISHKLYSPSMRKWQQSESVADFPECISRMIHTADSILGSAAVPDPTLLERMYKFADILDRCGTRMVRASRLTDQMKMRFEQTFTTKGRFRSEDVYFAFPRDMCLNKTFGMVVSADVSIFVTRLIESNIVPVVKTFRSLQRSEVYRLSPQVKTSLILNLEVAGGIFRCRVMRQPILKQFKRLCALRCVPYQVLPEYEVAATNFDRWLTGKTFGIRPNLRPFTDHAQLMLDPNEFFNFDYDLLTEKRGVGIHQKHMYRIPKLAKLSIDMVNYWFMFYSNQVDSVPHVVPANDPNASSLNVSNAGQSITARYKMPDYKMLSELDINAAAAVNHARKLAKVLARIAGKVYETVWQHTVSKHCNLEPDQVPTHSAMLENSEHVVKVPSSLATNSQRTVDNGLIRDGVRMLLFMGGDFLHDLSSTVKGWGTCPMRHVLVAIRDHFAKIREAVKTNATFSQQKKDILCDFWSMKVFAMYVAQVMSKKNPVTGSVPLVYHTQTSNRKSDVNPFYVYTVDPVACQDVLPLEQHADVDPLDAVVLLPEDGELLKRKIIINKFHSTIGSQVVFQVMTIRLVLHTATTMMYEREVPVNSVGRPIDHFLTREFILQMGETSIGDFWNISHTQVRHRIKWKNMYFSPLAMQEAIKKLVKSWSLDNYIKTGTVPAKPVAAKAFYQMAPVQPELLTRLRQWMNNTLDRGQIQNDVNVYALFSTNQQTTDLIDSKVKETETGIHTSFREATKAVKDTGTITRNYLYAYYTIWKRFLAFSLRYARSETHENPDQEKTNALEGIRLIFVEYAPSKKNPYQLT